MPFRQARDQAQIERYLDRLLGQLAELRGRPHEVTRADTTQQLLDPHHSGEPALVSVRFDIEILLLADAMPVARLHDDSSMA